MKNVGRVATTIAIWGGIVFLFHVFHSIGTMITIAGATFAVVVGILLTIRFWKGNYREYF